MPRKHLVASQTNKKQQYQAKMWQKLAKEIKAAAKVGGTNIEANPRLKAAVDKALQNNLSRESIERNINGASKDVDNATTKVFECYGPEGVQIILNTLTDNVNRTISNINTYLSKLHGQIAKPNSVMVFFQNNGYFIISKSPNLTYDHLMELTIDCEIVDIVEQEDAYEILSTVNGYYKVKETLATDKNVQIVSSEIKLIPANPVDNISQDTQERLNRFIDSCEQDDDIQWVVTNVQ